MLASFFYLSFIDVAGGHMLELVKEKRYKGAHSSAEAARRSSQSEALGNNQMLLAHSAANSHWFPFAA